MRQYFQLSTLFFGALFFQCAESLHAQSNYRLRHYDFKDGLSQEYIHDIRFDSVGYLWLLHENLLTKYDGYKSVPYYFNQQDSIRRLRSRESPRMFVTPRGNIWVLKGDAKGNPTLVRYNRSADRFEKVNLKIDYLWDLVFEEDESTLWVSNGQGISKHDLRLFVTSYFPLQGAGEFIDQGQALLIGTKNGLWEFDKQSLTFRRPQVNPRDSATLFQSNIVSVIKSKEGDVLLELRDIGFLHLNSNLDVVHTINATYDEPLYDGIGGDGEFWLVLRNQGLIHYRTAEKTWRRIVKEGTNNKGLLSNSVTSPTFNKEGHLWVATGKGISRLEKPMLNVFNYSYENTQLANLVRLIRHNGNENIIIGTSDFNSFSKPLELFQAEIPTVDSQPLHLRKVAMSEIKGLAHTLSWVDDKLS
jgi:ligand-binding sensor domain-containing protein